MTEKIGTTIGYITPDKLIFASEQRFSLGEYVCVTDEIAGKERTILGKIEDLVFSNPSSVSQALPSLGAPRDALPDAFLKLKDLFIMAQTKVIGYIDDDGNLKSVKTIIRPGLPVFLPSKELLEQFVNIDAEISVRIGKLSSREDVAIKISGERLLSPTLIAGHTGTGKSTFALNVARQLSQRAFSSIVFDLTGEYEYLIREKAVDNSRSYTLRVPLASLRAEEIAKLTEASDTQRYFLESIYQKQERFESLDELISALNRETRTGVQRRSIDALIQKLLLVRDFFGDQQESIEKICEPGTITVLDMSKFPNRIQDFLIYWNLEKLLRDSRYFEDKLRFVVIDDASRTGDLSRDVMLRSAREGRKYGVGLCIVTQSITLLPFVLTSICENFVLFRTNPRDIAHLAQIINEETSKTMRNLELSEAYLFGPFLRIPVVARVQR